MTIIAKQVFTTADGKQFDNRKDAEAHEVVAARIVKVLAAFPEAPADVASWIATNGDALILALTNPLERGRKKAAAPAATGAGAFAPAETPAA